MKENGIEKLIYSVLMDMGVNSYWANMLNNIIALILLLLLSYLLFWVSKKIINGVFHRLAKKSKTIFDDILIKNRVPKILAYVPSFFILVTFLPPLMDGLPDGEAITFNILEALGVVITILLIRSLLSALKDYLKTLRAFKDKPIDSYVQVFMIFIWFIGIILILSLLTGKDITSFLTTLGALSAVILLIFKDSILGFVASIQVSINDTVRIGDWITMKNANADGDVIEINLSTVKVQNFDKTITSIPTYKLVSDSFVNWRGMSDSDGRRIKRAILIKVSSIRFIKNEEINQLEKIERIGAFIKERKEHIEKYNAAKTVDKSLLINGRNLTNLGLFRYYTEMYLQQHPEINQNMTLMCRQLAPTSQGLPLEIYAFTKDKVWGNYERIMADIFDHLLSSMTYFDLECFELSPAFPVQKK